MDTKIRNEKYLQYVEAKSPKTSPLKSLFWAFLIGGVICCIAQGIYDALHALMPGMKIEEAKTWALIGIVFLSILLTGLGVFDEIGIKAGAGTFLPISGFANAVASPSIDYKSEGWVFGLGAKMFYIAGPVIVNGVAWSIVAVFVHWLIFDVIFK